MRIASGAVLILAATAIAGCSGGFGFGGPKKSPAAVDPNLYPVNYRSQILTLLMTSLTDRADFHNALISPPMLKPVPEGRVPHYLVCIQLNGHNERKDKVVVFLGGQPNEFIDATPEECGDAAYQPFAELERVTPPR